MQLMYGGMDLASERAKQAFQADPSEDGAEVRILSQPTPPERASLSQTIARHCSTSRSLGTRP